MSDELTPEQYLAKLEKQVRPPQPQTLRQSMTPMEVEGLLAYTYRTKGPEASMELNYELDQPLKSYSQVESEAQARKKSKKPWLWIAVLGAMALVLVFAAIFNQDSSSDRSTDIASASGVQKQRGVEAQAALQRFTIPDSWIASAPEVSMSGDEESSYAFYEQSWTTPEQYSVEDFRSWFKEQSVVQEHSEEATCETDLKETEATCEVHLYTLDQQGYRNYDVPYQTVTFMFHTSTEDGLEPASVRGEAYATD